MESFSEAFASALQMILSADPTLWGIVGLSLQVSLTAVFFAALIGIPLGALLAIKKFWGRPVLIVLVNALMGLPPVVVGLCVYLMLSKSGPLGILGLLYTPTAMIIAQTLLIAPIIAALSRTILKTLHEEYRDQFASFRLSQFQTVNALLWEARFMLLTALLAGFGRAIAEVGAVMIVGGNISHYTRVMTTSIALETSKGNLSLALALGVILILLAILVNGALSLIGMQRREDMHV
ncbi:MAG: ABC transporter permease [Proteobacteria bacterium]|jgi:tungstate transport system permease protein|nr:ABC transporter permease [Paracoccaceae bacterium]MDA0318046.1 ABC transporter permease [Pseudomonadota bacterium]MDA0850002.1 ABC transporter permease [Pseudomonadota bacterium]MDA1294098.1 ABC transporter permease [Pseudomonadota bacterium]